MSRSKRQLELSDSDDDQGNDVRGRLVHATLGSIQKEVQRLAATSKLQFPLPSNGLSFATHDAARIHILAAALQRGFTLYLSTSNHFPIGFNLWCTRNHARFISKGEERCEFSMRIGYDGVAWRCVSVTGTHIGHEVEAEDVAGNMLAPLPKELVVPPIHGGGHPKVIRTGLDAKVPKKRKSPLEVIVLDSTASPELAGPSTEPRGRHLAALPGHPGPSRVAIPAATPRLPTLNKGAQKKSGAPYISVPIARHSSSQSTPAHSPSASQPTRRVGNSAPSRASTSALPRTLPSTIPTPTPIPDASSAFAPHLALFLAHLSPSLPSQTTLLLASGINNFDRLATLILLSNEHLLESGWIVDLARGVVRADGAVVKGLPKILEIVFLKGLERIRAEWRYLGDEVVVKEEEQEDGVDWAE